MEPRDKENYDRLYPFQKEGVKFLLDRKAALLADEVGVGKTAQALVAARMLQAERVLVICTASIKHDWRHRAIEWGFKPHEVIVLDRPQDIEGFRLVVINYDLCFRRDYVKILTRVRYDVLICDEAHALKNHKAKRTRAVYGSGGYLSRSNRCWLLTGTPVLNRPEELYTTLKALCPERLGPFVDYIQFTRRYCNGHAGTWGWIADGATNVEELAQKLEGFMLRRERDVLADLPEKIMRLVYLPRNSQIDAVIFQEQAEGEQVSIRQRMGLAKIDATLRYLTEKLDTEPKLVVFAYHKEVIDRLRAGMEGYGPVVITGDVPPKARHDLIQKFRSDKNTRIVILQIDAAGTGIDGLQSVCRHAVFAEISYVPGVNHQAMGRIHRNGQKGKAIFDFLVVEGSLDECVLSRNVYKSKVVKKLMGDSNTIFNFNEEQGEKTMEEPINVVTIVLESDKMEALQRATEAAAEQKGVKFVRAEISFAITPILDQRLPEIPMDRPVPVAEAPEAPKAAPAKRGRKKEPEQAAGMTFPTPAPAPAAMFGGAPVRPELLVGVTPATYQQSLAGAANKIQAFGSQTGQPGLLSELGGQLQTMFPGTPNVMTIVDPNDQKRVVDAINSFAAAKGIV